VLRYTYLSDPIEPTREIDISKFHKYLDIARAQRGPTDEKLIKEIKDQLYEYHLNSKNEAKLERIWKFLIAKLGTNAGLANFILEFGGAKSNFFFPWLMNIFLAPSAVLEMAYGAGPNIDGHWVDNIPAEDPIIPFVKNEPNFIYHRERELHVADLVTNVQQQSIGKFGRVSKVVDFCTGRMPWARRYGFDFAPEDQTIMVFDKDPTLRAEKILHTKEGESLNVVFKHGDIMSQASNPECMDSDLIIAVGSGAAPYTRIDAFAQAVISPVYHLLNPGGIFFFDLRINAPCVRYITPIFGWPKLYLMDSVASAVKSVEEIRKNLWRNGQKFSAEYTVDSHLELPSGVMVTLQRL